MANKVTRKLNKKIYKYFKDWLKLNNHKFKHKICIIKQKKRYLKLKYENIILNIVPELHLYNGINLSIYHNNEWWDMIFSDDVYSHEIKKTKKGYYCRLCVIKRYYKSRRELYYHHCFDHLLKWSNENIIKDNFLVLLGNGYQEAKIVTKKEIKDYIKDEDLKVIYPLKEN